MLEIATNNRHLLQPTIHYKQWDYIHTFKPHPSLNLENGSIFDVKTLLPGLFEYEFVEKMFKDSWSGLKAFGQPTSHFNRIVSVEKLFNCVLYDKFLVEFKNMLRKYKTVPINLILKHLFHGPGATDPSLVYKSESGLDMRFSKPGMYGKGIYFAEQSSYSD